MVQVSGLLVSRRRSVCGQKMADHSNDQMAGLAKVQAKDRFVFGNDTALTIDVPPAAAKHPSLSQRFENSPIDQTVDVPRTESQSKCGYLGAVKLPYICLLRKVSSSILIAHSTVFISVLCYSSLFVLVV